MLRRLVIALGVSVALIAGAASAFAATTNGSIVQSLAASTSLSGKAKGAAISNLAKTHEETRVDSNATVGANATDEDEDAETDEDAHASASSQDNHGAAVRVVAQDRTATGGDNENHGGAVSVVAQTHP
jgi:hypothetical protein